jgi:hypothetical protein
MESKLILIPFGERQRRGTLPSLPASLTYFEVPWKSVYTGEMFIVGEQVCAGLEGEGRVRGQSKNSHLP